MGITLAIIYTASLSFILLYSLTQFHLLLTYLRGKSSTDKRQPALSDQNLPLVTIQLPLFNEKYVTARLIDAVAAFDYPRHLLEIQILDDSTDETVEIAAKKAEDYRKQGLDIVHVRRPNRAGYKAGALEYGLSMAKGDFIAIFDADFLPKPDFLKKTLPWFQDPAIGVVQTRWQHLNEDYSLLTQLQAFALDAHFSVEQKGRNQAGCFINFNGTAGIWRKATIADAGGWQADTLTEDLDLSYRAQLKGWKFMFMEEIESPSELPASMPAVKSQQFRWTKGAAETARKNLGSVLLSKLPLHVKIHATFHLLNSFLFICVLSSGLLSLPILILKQQDPSIGIWLQWGALFQLSLIFLMALFFVARWPREEGNSLQKTLKFAFKFPLFLSLSMGMALHNALATLEGYIGKKSPFIRTPKFNLVSEKDVWRNKKAYLTKALNPLTILEGILAIYFFAGIWIGIEYQDFKLIPYHSLLAFGYSGVFFLSVKHSFSA